MRLRVVAQVACEYEDRPAAGDPDGPRFFCREAVQHGEDLAPVPVGQEMIDGFMARARANLRAHGWTVPEPGSGGVTLCPEHTLDPVPPPGSTG